MVARRRDQLENPELAKVLIGTVYPGMAGYCSSIANTDYFSWTSRFLYPTSWLAWGDTAITPEEGDIVVFNFGAGDSHGWEYCYVGSWRV